MGTFLIILIILFIVWPLVRQPLSRGFSGFAARRSEDFIRRMMGMPTRKEEERRRRQQRKNGQGRRKDTRRAAPPHPHPAAIMKSVADDVEFVEIHEFEQRVTVEETPGKTRIKVEEQITDADFTEIKG